MSARIINGASIVIVGLALVFFLKAWLTGDGDGSAEWGVRPEGLSADFVQAANTGHRLGSDDAPVMLVLYSDYACGFSREFHHTLQSARLRYPEHLAVVVKPFRSLDATEATRLSLAANCAAEQGMFEQFHNEAFRVDGVSHWSEVADSVDLPDRTAFDRCVGAAKYAGRLEDDFEAAWAMGVRIVPTSVINGRLYSGALGSAALDSAIANALPRAW